MTSRSFIVLLFAAFPIPDPALAQTIALAPSDPKRWDASVGAGWLGGDKSGSAEEWNDWYDTFAASLEVGRYWTPHVKSEVAATFTTEGDVYSSEPIDVPGLPSPVYYPIERRYRITAVNASAAYQFLENAWVHPFMAGGLQLAWERRRIEGPHFPALGRGGRPPSVKRPAETGTRFDPRPFLSGGAKFYVAERGFIRTDLSAAVDGRGATRVWWRIGAGMDF